MRITDYQRFIMELSGCTHDEARCLEGAMRLEYGTLDHLPASRFRQEAKTFLPAIRRDFASWDELARSYGL